MNLHLVQGVQIFHTTTRQKENLSEKTMSKRKKEKMYFLIYQGGNDFVNLLSLLRLGSTSFRDIFLSAMYISNYLNKRAERLRFRAVFGGYCHLPAQNSSRRQVTGVL